MNLWQDLRYGLRVLRLNAGYTLIAILTLALGIGANTAIFTVINAVLLRPLPYPESERLLLLAETSPEFESMSIAYPNFVDWREQNRVFDELAVYRRQSYNLTEGGEPEQIVAGQVSPSLFTALGVAPALGRNFTAAEDRPAGEPVAILSHGLWQRRFGGEAGIVGRQITLSNRRYTVVGVMPAGFLFPSRVEMWTPVGQEAGRADWQNRGNHPGLFGIARLKKEVMIDEARAEMTAIALRLEQQYPEANKGSRVLMVSLFESTVRGIRRSLWVLLAAVGLVLLIACANVANLSLARAARRQREMAIRAALGAGRGRLARQLLSESLLLAMAGGALGLLIAEWGVDLLVAANPGSLPRAGEISLDSRVLLFTLGASCLTGLLFGLVPAWQAGRVNLSEALKDAARGAGLGYRQRFRSALIIVEVALSTVLLLGAGLLLRSFYALQQIDPGFQTDDRLTFQITLPPAKYREEAQRVVFFQELERRIAALPGVEAVSFSSGLPLGNNGSQSGFWIEGRGDVPQGERPATEEVSVSPGFLRAMGMTLIRGRELTPQDRAGTEPVALIDEIFAARYFPDEDPLGRRLRFGHPPHERLVTIVGVVRRVKMDGLVRDSGRVQAYFSALQSTRSGMSFVIKASVDPFSLAAPVRASVASIDADQPIYNLRTMEQMREETLSPQRLNMILLGLFAILALLLSAIGLYGVMSYTVAQRTPEIGIRLALGAEAGDVLRLVIGQGARLTAVGLLIGVGGGALLTRWMSSLLYGVSAHDPTTFAAIPLLLATVALAATIPPARRAMRVDPMVALRHE